MRYESAHAFRDALEQRLRNQAQSAGVTVMRLRKRVAFERYLARLATAAPERWILKGALALDLRLGLGTRTTKDIDLARTDDEQAATADLAAAAALDLGDFFSYRVRRTSTLDKTIGFHAIRYNVIGDLAGRAFEQFPLDVAFTAASTLDAERLWGPGALVFAGIAPIELPVVALEQHIAEKIHAYTSSYGVEQRESTRSKDLVDLVLIGLLARPRAGRLRIALESTFHERDRQPLPTTLPPPPSVWAQSYAAQARDLDLPTDLATAHKNAAGLIDPVFRGTANGSWEPMRRRWQDGT
jgi:predicted nucleotidyltransferase component of viral defense system